MIVAAFSADTLSSWLPLIALATAGYMFFRGGGGTAITALQAANTVLEKRVKELEQEDLKKAKRIAELEGRTDVAIAILPVLDALRVHEVEAAKRSEATLGVLALIAERVGPETDKTLELLAEIAKRVGAD